MMIDTNGPLQVIFVLQHRFDLSLQLLYNSRFHHMNEGKQSINLNKQNQFRKQTSMILI